MKQLQVAALVVALLLVPAGGSQAQDTVAKLQALLEGAGAADAPGVALGVVRNGDVVFAGHRGLENLETRTPAGPNSRFNIASNAKQFTALTVLDLAQTGKLSLDDDVRRHVPDAFPNFSTPITIRQLIAHTSGVRDVYDLWSLEGRTWWQSFIGNDDAIQLLGRQTALNFEPGSAHLYSNSNYIVLTKVAAAASGRSFGEQTADLFTRLEMRASGYATDAAVPIANRARPYADCGNGWIEYPAVTSIYGDGWLFTTLGDQLRYEQLVQDGDDPLLVEAQSPVWPSYGFGLEHSGQAGSRHIWHDGSTGAQSASLSRFPDCGVSVVAMSNNGKVSTRALVAQAAEIVLEGCAAPQARFPDRPTTSLADVQASDIVGVYRQSGGGADIRVVNGEDGLRREIEGREPVRLIADGPGLYRYESNPNLRMAFDRTPAGLPRLTIFAATQPPAVAVRYEEAAPGSSDDWAGEYSNAETGADLIVRASGDVVTIRLNDDDLTGRSLGADVLVAGGYQIMPVRENGVVERLLVDGARVRGVEFRRSQSSSD